MSNYNKLIGSLEVLLEISGTGISSYANEYYSEIKSGYLDYFNRKKQEREDFIKRGQESLRITGTEPTPEQTKALEDKWDQDNSFDMEGFFPELMEEFPLEEGENKWSGGPAKRWFQKWCDLHGFGKMTRVVQKGGTDQGSEWYIIKHYEGIDVYLKTEGYYSSYEGTYFEEGLGDAVRPKQKTITVYE